MRDQFCHAVDLLPPVLDAAGIAAPAAVDGVDQLPPVGASLRSSITAEGADAPDPRSTQYFEIIGSRSIVHDGWKATTDHIGNQITVERELVPGSHDVADDRWALFDLADDFSEAHDLSVEHPERVTALVERWWHEARRNHLLPLEHSLVGRRWPCSGTRIRRACGGCTARAAAGWPRTSCPPWAAASASWPTSRSPRAAARACCAPSATGTTGGPGTCSTAGRPWRSACSGPRAAGAHALAVTYERAPTGDGALTLQVDGEDVAGGDLPEDLPLRWQIGGAGLRVGLDAGFPVHEEYHPPFPFRGTIDHVAIESAGYAPPVDRADVTIARAARHE